MKLFQNVQYSILNQENIRFMRFCNRGRGAADLLRLFHLCHKPEFVWLHQGF